VSDGIYFQLNFINITTGCTRIRLSCICLYVLLIYMPYIVGLRLALFTKPKSVNTNLYSVHDQSILNLRYFTLVSICIVIFWDMISRSLEGDFDYQPITFIFRIT
jgi:hypothetical protein